METPKTLDEIAEALYGSDARYAGLSPWGKQTVEDVARVYGIKQELPKEKPETTELKAELIQLRVQNKELTEKLSAAVTENDDLWYENEELRLALLEKEQGVET